MNRYYRAEIDLFQEQPTPKLSADDGSVGLTSSFFAADGVPAKLQQLSIAHNYGSPNTCQTLDGYCVTGVGSKYWV